MESSGKAQKNIVLGILGGDRKGGPVCSSPLVTVTLEQMEACGCYYPESHEDPFKMAKLAGFIHASVGFQGIRVPFDLCVEAEAFGCRLKGGERESPPSVAGIAFEEGQGLYIPEDIFQRGRFKAVFGAVRLLHKEFSRKASVFPGIVGPLTLLGQLYDVSHVMCWPIEDPQRLDERLEMAAGFLSEYANRLLESGGDAIIISDPAASGDLLSRKFFQRHVMPVYLRLRKMISGPVVLHICGNTLDFLDLLPVTGFEGFSFEGPAVPVKAVRQAIGDAMVLIGNIPTYDVLLSGSPEMVMEESLRALEDGVDLLAPACGIPVRTPLENLRVMVKAVERFRGEKRAWTTRLV